MAYTKGTVFGSPLFVLRCYGNDVGVTRWGFAVGKRIAKRAVVRNRTKRRIREIARGLKVTPGLDLVVVARAPAITADASELADGLARVLRRAGALVVAE
mgnify:CR=1 FL=1